MRHNKDVDVLDAIAFVRRTFQQAKLKAPAAIILGSNEQGMLFLSAIKQDPFLMLENKNAAQPMEMADGSIWMEIKIMDIAVRWPACRHVAHDGSWRYV